MVKIYKYGGKVSAEHFDAVKSFGDIRLSDFLKGIQLDQLDQKSAGLVSALRSKLIMMEQEGQRTPVIQPVVSEGAQGGSADNEVLMMFRLLKQYGNRAFPERGTLAHWVVVYRYLTDHFDALEHRVSDINGLIRMVNLQIGLLFNPHTDVSDAIELMGMEADDDTISSWRSSVPDFVVEAFLNNSEALAPFESKITEHTTNSLFGELSAVLTDLAA